MKTIQGKLNATLGELKIEPVTPAKGYLISAKKLMEGAEILAMNNLSYSLTFLCGQIVECLLKSFVAAKTNLNECQIKNKFGHDLCALWKESYSLGLLVDEEPPAWVLNLNHLHSEFILRYPIGFNGLALPNQKLMMEEIRNLFASTKQCI